MECGGKSVLFARDHSRHPIFWHIAQKGPLAGGYRRIRDRSECSEHRGIITGALCREVATTRGGARPKAWRLTCMPLSLQTWLTSRHEQTASRPHPKAHGD